MRVVVTITLIVLHKQVVLVGLMIGVLLVMVVLSMISIVVRAISSSTACVQPLLRQQRRRLAHSGGSGAIMTIASLGAAAMDHCTCLHRSRG